MSVVKLGFIVASCLLLLLASGCNDSLGDHSEMTGRLIVTGSSTVAPLAVEMARQFERNHPGVRIDVQTGGSGKGIADARNGVSDIGMASRELKEDERDLTAHRIAADGVSLIVHQSNMVSELTNQQVVDIYQGKIKNWKQVGGFDRAVTVVHKAEGRATLDVFLNYFDLKNPTVKADVIVGENEHCVKTVDGTPGAIGYVSIGTAEADVKAGIGIRLLPVGGIEASTECVAMGEFPMSRSLNLVTKDSPSRLAKAFIKFCQSESVHDLVVSHYFVPIKD